MFIWGVILSNPNISYVLPNTTLTTHLLLFWMIPAMKELFPAFTTSMCYGTGYLLFLGVNNGSEAFRPETPNNEQKENKSTDSSSQCLWQLLA
jgi:hypothetical protein